MCQTVSYKDQGNAEYKKGNWLKAAGLYTKGIKEDPESAILYSNRSAALLQLKKAAKALEDAEQCISLRPDWDKGHYRKGLALELQGGYNEALQAVEAALKCNPQNEEMAKKARALKRMRDLAKPQSKKDKENQEKNKPVNRSTSIQGKLQGSAQGARVVDELPQLDADTAEFQRECISFAVDAELLEPSVYFLGPPAADVESAMSQVKIKEAFQSPDLLQNCTGFLREYASEKSARAACAVVSLKDIAFPQVWKRQGWPHGEVQGALVQLDTPKERRLWFMPADAMDVSGAVPLSQDFRILEPLFR
ncbi:g8073 [Coccomyxa elongata]